MEKNVLVIGSGGREHALAWALARSSQTGQIYVATGNAGHTCTANPEKDIAACATVDITPMDFPALIDFAKKHGVDLAVVGPEAPLAAGIVDAFQAAGLRAFGPVREAAMLESSKAFAKEIMQARGIPTAAYRTFTDYDAAQQYITRLNYPVVIKADGLAAGKRRSVFPGCFQADKGITR